MIDVKFVWLQEEDRNEDISIALIIREQFSPPPCSSRTFWKQSCWSFVTGQCGDWNWNIPLHLPRWIHILSSFYLQQWICTWSSKFEQKTNSVLLVCWSKRWKSQRPWIYWLLCTTSRAMHAQCMEEALRRGILGRYRSFHQGRMNILFNTIECNCSSRNTSSPLCFESWKIENWRNLVWKTILVSTTTTNDLTETRSRLDWKEWSIGLYSWTAASWKTRSTVFWRSTTCWIFQTNPIQTQSNLWSNLETRGDGTCFVEKGKTSHLQEIDDQRLQKEIGSSDRTWKPVKTEDNRVMHVHYRTGNPWESSTNTHSATIWFSRTSWYCIIKREQV